MAGLVGLLGRQGWRQRLHKVSLHRTAPLRHCCHASGPRRIQYRIPGRGRKGVNQFEWDEDLAVRPEHFADMVYQTCALSKGGCVSEMLVYGLAQDVSGFANIKNNSLKLCSRVLTDHDISAEISRARRWQGPYNKFEKTCVAPKQSKYKAEIGMQVRPLHKYSFCSATYQGEIYNEKKLFALLTHAGAHRTSSFPHVALPPQPHRHPLQKSPEDRVFRV